MNNETYKLTHNAFFILGAEYGSTRSDIADLCDDAEFDELFEPEIIQRAQQNLLAPMARLEQEISWLTELSQAQITTITELTASDNLPELLEVTRHLPELAKANILAHFCGTQDFSGDLLHALVAAWAEVDPSHIINFINESRKNSGFPTVQLQQVGGALKGLEALHAKSAAIGVWALDRPGETMDRIVEAELKMHPSSSFLEKFVRAYDALSEPDLAQIGAEIDSVISRVEQPDANLGPLISLASSLLVRWDEINQPVQVYEQHQGHEEGRSKRIYEKLRVLCLDLANNRGEYAEAQRLSEALLRTFPELESVAEVLKGDVAQLETLVEQQKQHDQLEPLAAACEGAKNQIPKLKKSLTKSGFSSASKGPVANIFVAFDIALSSLDDHTLAFIIVRDLALYINNDRNDPETAFRLVNGLINYSGAHPSAEIAAKLDEERAVLHRNWKMGELDKNAGKLGVMSQILDDLLKYANGQEKTELEELKKKIDRKRLWKKLKWGVYASIAIIIGFSILLEEIDRPPRRTTYRPTTQVVSPPTQSPTSTPVVERELMPQIGQGLALNRSQVRYCVFQGRRLEAIRLLTDTNNKIAQFNHLIDDFNSRCSNYRYRNGVLTSIQRDAREKAAELQADARRIVSSW